MRRTLRLIAVSTAVLGTAFLAGGWAVKHWNGAAAAGRQTKLNRAGSGDIAVTATINGARVPMVLDTGATSVVLTRDAARAAGLPLEVLNFSVTMETANGSTLAAPVTLDRLTVGGISERGVPALIVQRGKTSLLGMSFLNRLQSWEVRDDAVSLRAYP